MVLVINNLLEEKEDERYCVVAVGMMVNNLVKPKWGTNHMHITCEKIDYDLRAITIMHLFAADMHLSVCMWEARDCPFWCPLLRF